MKINDFLALCAMAKSAGITTLGQLRLFSKLCDCSTNDDLLIAVESEWDRKRAVGLNES